MTNKHIKDLINLALRFIFVGIFIGLLIMPIASGFSLPLLEIIEFSTVFSFIGAVLIFLPLSVAKTKNQANDPYRFSRVLKRYYELPENLNIETTRIVNFGFSKALKSEENIFLWKKDPNSKDSVKITINLLASNTSKKRIEVIAEPESKIKIYNGSLNKEATDLLSSTLSLDVYKIPINEKGTPLWPNY